MTPSGTRGVLNDAISIYFVDATLARAKVETAGGAFRVREDEPELRVEAGCTGHRERIRPTWRPTKGGSCSLTSDFHDRYTIADILAAWLRP